MFRFNSKGNGGLSRVFATRAVLSVLLTGAPAVFATGLPDTGIDTCRDTAHAMVPCAAAAGGDASTYPRQDGRFGWDPAAIAAVFVKTGAGSHGFDYTKIANNGTVLSPGAVLGTAPTDWACTRDNITGLVWEVKTADGLLRDKGWTYSWFNSVAGTNGGGTGTTSGGTCQTAGRCDTEKFVADVNTATLCGASDWRMPTLRELQTVVDVPAIPSVDPTYFPNTIGADTWTGSPFAGSPAGASAWDISFSVGGSTLPVLKSGAFPVRLVRGAGF